MTGRTISTAPALLALALAPAAPAFAHGVTAGDNGYIQEITGLNILPFVCLGATCACTAMAARRSPAWAGRGVSDADGTLVAAFDGNHGWFWRNRGDAPITVALRSQGAHAGLKGVI